MVDFDLVCKKQKQEAKDFIFDQSNVLVNDFIINVSDVDDNGKEVNYDDIVEKNLDQEV